jgi:GGDEF domain-containing protein
VGLRILILGRIEEDVRRELASLRGGSTILEPASGTDLAAAIRGLSPDLAVVGQPSSLRRILDPDGPEALSRRVEHEYVRSVRFRHPLGVALLTLDGRPEMERAHGEAAVEAFDDAVVAAARRALREADILFRPGPSEIALILPETEPAGCRVVAERLRATVAHLLFKPEAAAPLRPSLPLKARASIGLAGSPNEGIRSGADLLARARAAMSAARTAGGDRVAEAP